MKVAIAGTGKVATWMLRALSLKQGIQVMGVWGRHRPHAETIASGICPVIQSLDALVALPADIVVLAVNDDAIDSLASALKNAQAALVHCSGAYNDRTLTDGFVWPVYSINAVTFQEHEVVPIAYNSFQDTHAQAIHTLSQGLGHAFKITPEQKPWLHLAATMTNNFMHHLLAKTADLLDEHGLQRALLQPILEQTVSNFYKENLQALQTGAAARGDEKTLALHEHMLAGTPQLLNLYKCLSQSIMTEYTAK